MKIWVDRYDSSNYYFDKDSMINEECGAFAEALNNYLLDDYSGVEIFHLSEEKKEKIIEYVITNNFIEINVPDIKNNEPRSIEELETAPIETITVEELREYCKMHGCNSVCRFSNDEGACYFFNRIPVNY